MTDSPYVRAQAEIDWQSDTPVSRTYGDIYWHRDAGVEEKKFVFIEPLSRHLAKLPAATSVTVAELGFGFGTNMLLAAEFWQHQHPNSFLNLISIEAHPVAPVDL